MSFPVTLSYHPLSKLCPLLPHIFTNAHHLSSILVPPSIATVFTTTALQKYHSCGVKGPYLTLW